MNDQIPPNNDEAGESAKPVAPVESAVPSATETSAPAAPEPNHELQLPQPIPPVYAPPPVQGPPSFDTRSPYSGPPQSAQQPPAQAQFPQAQPTQQTGWPQPQQQAPGTPPVQPSNGQVPPSASQQYGPPQPGQAPYAQPQYGQQPQAPQYGQASQQPTQPAQPGAWPSQAQQQPGAQQYAQGQQYPGQQYAQGQPQMAAGPTGVKPPRKGLPVGAWIGIGAGALVLLLVVIIGIGMAIMLNKPAAPDPLPAPPTIDAPEPEAPETPTQLDFVTLDDPADFTSGPYWGVPFEDGWDIVRFDEQGVNEFKNVTAGCMFFTYQGYGPEALKSTDDRGATEETLSTALQIGLPWDAATKSPEVNPDGTVEMPVDYAYSVEMSRYVALYPTADGDRQRQILLRTFMPDNLALYAEVDCPATADGDKVAQKILDGLTITEF